MTGEGFDASEDGTGRGTPSVPVQPYTLGIQIGSAVRRLTPKECERLQGFPDDYTAIPLRNAAGKLNGKWAKDGPRYKALGNSWAVPVARWIGRRIEMVDAIKATTEAAA